MTKESPYKSLLIYHGVGVGKTCTGVSIAENFRDSLSSKDKRIIIVTLVPLRFQHRRERNAKNAGLY